MFGGSANFYFYFVGAVTDIRLLLSSVSPGIHMENKTSANRNQYLIEHEVLSSIFLSLK